MIEAEQRLTRQTVLRVALCAALALAVVSLGRLEGASSVPVQTHYLNNHYSFVYELGSTHWVSHEAWRSQMPFNEWAAQWPFNLEAPFKYRLLGLLPIYFSTKLTAGLFDSYLAALYSNYIVWVFLFAAAYLFVASGFTAELLRKMLHPKVSVRDDKFFLASAMFYAALPPVALAFKFPVHAGPNDFLGYALIAGALLALIQDRLSLFLLLVCIGVFCRETVLVALLPFLFSEQPLRKRLLFLLAPLLLLLLYRVAWPGSYHPVNGARLNMQRPFETLAFFGLTFSFVWPASVLGFLEARKNAGAHPFVKSMVRSYLPSILVVTLIVLALARMREIRIEYVLFFTVVPFALFYFFSSTKPWYRYVASRYSALSLVAAAIATLYSYNFLTPITQAAHNAVGHALGGFYSGFGGGWKGVALVYFGLSVYVCLMMIVRPLMERGESDRT